MEFKTLITRVGLAKIANATALGYKINLKQMAFGDGNGEYPTINEDMTQLVNEVHRGDINNVEVVDDNVIRISQVIPAQVGGFFIREVGVYDEEDDLIAIGVFPESYKPTIEEGATKDIMARMLLRVSNVDSVALKIDPNVVVATKKDIEDLRDEFEIIVGDIDLSDIEDKIKGLEENKADKDKIIDIVNQNIEDLDIEDEIHFHLWGSSVRESRKPSDFENGITITEVWHSEFPSINEAGTSATFINKLRDGYAQILVTSSGDIWARASDDSDSWGEWYSVEKENDNIKNIIGDLSALETKDKSNVVEAINELYNFKQDRPLTYGVTIDNNNANPETRVKYIDDAVGFKPVRGNNGNTDWGSWKDTFIYEKFKPCVVKNGEVQYYLDREDFTKKESGGTANLTGADGDVMIEIDKMWYKIENDGDEIYVRVSEAYQNGFKCLAHTNGDKEVDRIYVGAYLGYEQDGKLRSISGVEPSGDKSIGSFRDLAEANGDRYHQVPFTALTLLQSIMVILLKSTDTQTALGRGHVDDGSIYSETGNTNKKGMMFGETGGKANSGQMCFMGIEDFWGNKRWWIDGLKYDGGNIKLGTTSFNDNANGYKIVGKYPNTGGGYIKAVTGTSEAGYVPTDLDGSSSTYYCDFGHVDDGRFPSFGGYRSSGSGAGGFILNSYSASFSFAYLGSRLFMYGK